MKAKPQAKLRWTAYSQREIVALTAKPEPPTNKSKRHCPICSQQAVKFYYHEFRTSGRVLGTSYFWCNRCFKYAHFSGEPLSSTFGYDDPFEKLSVTEFGELEGNDFCDRLDQLWERGVLPQTFVQK